MNAERTSDPGSTPEQAGRDRRARLHSALADPVRVGVVDLLQVQDLSPDALAARLDVPGNLLAHHLKVLQSAGLVTRAHSQSDRRRTYVHLVPDALSGLLPESASLSAARVVFVCTHNSARSVLAEAAWHTVSAVPATSAGTHPADRINPRARTAARRAGLRLQRPAPQSIEAVLRPDDVIVSVCDAVNEHLDAVDNSRLHWSVPDPATIDTDAAFDAALAEIGGRVTRLARQVELVPTAVRRT